MTQGGKNYTIKKKRNNIVEESASVEIRQAVAYNIHRIRKGQKLSIERTAELTGVSKSMLGQIERGAVNPTITVLAKIADGLHVPLEQLIAHRTEDPVMLYRGVDSMGERLDGGKVICYDLFPYVQDSGSESRYMSIFLTGVYQAQDQIPHSRVYITVLSGTVEICCGEEKFTLENRDSLTFPGYLPHRYTNVCNATVRLIERIQYKKEQ